MKRKETNINESWKKVLRKMDMGELMLIVHDYESYSPELIALAEDVLTEQYGITEEELDSIISKPDKLIEGETGTRDLLLNVLEKMGCGKSINFDSISFDDDGTCAFSFSCMEESFYASATNDRVFAEIVKYCHDCPLDDKEGITIVKKAINKVNENKIAKMYYSIDKEYNLFYVECCLCFLLIPLIPNIEQYIYSQLIFINRAEQYFDSILESEKGKEEKR